MQHRSSALFPCKSRWETNNLLFYTYLNVNQQTQHSWAISSLHRLLIVLALALCGPFVWNKISTSWELRRGPPQGSVTHKSQLTSDLTLYSPLVYSTRTTDTNTSDVLLFRSFPLSSWMTEKNLNVCLGSIPEFWQGGWLHNSNVVSGRAVIWNSKCPSRSDFLSHPTRKRKVF